MQNKQEETLKPQEPTKEQLQMYLVYMAGVKKSAERRKARCEELMQRPGTKKWKAEKTAKMVRRLMTASQEIEQASDLIEKVNLKLNEKQNSTP